MPAVTLLTPTADQPTGMALCERYMARQSAWSSVAQWIVVDDGHEPARLTLGQEHIRRDREPDCTGAVSLCRNLLAGLERVRGDLIVVIEHDDYYSRTHLAWLLDQLARPNILLAGDSLQRYYHVGTRQYKTYHNRGACLCQTGFRRVLLPRFEVIVRGQLAEQHYGIDGRFWRSVSAAEKHSPRVGTAAGIKGLPGPPGLGVGHRPTPLWGNDPELRELRRWIGPDAETYRPFYREGA